MPRDEAEMIKGGDGINELMNRLTNYFAGNERQEDEVEEEEEEDGQAGRR